jgi:hypothetical protein
MILLGERGWWGGSGSAQRISKVGKECYNWSAWDMLIPS